MGALLVPPVAAKRSSRADLVCFLCFFIGACLHLAHCGTPQGEPHIGEPPPPLPLFFRTLLFLLPPVSSQPSAPPHRPFLAAHGAASAAAVTSGDGSGSAAGGFRGFWVLVPSGTPCIVHLHTSALRTLVPGPIVLELSSCLALCTSHCSFLYTSGCCMHQPSALLCLGHRCLRAHSAWHTLHHIAASAAHLVTCPSLAM